MKNWIYKLAALTASVLLAAPSWAQETYVPQLEDKILPVSHFTSVQAEDDFEISLERGAYSAKVIADRILMPYVQVYVRSNTLFVTYDEKSVPKDVKKLYKGKGAATALFRVVVTMPELSGLTLLDNAVLTSSDEFNGSAINITLNDKAQVKYLSLNGASFRVNMQKNAVATLNLVAGESIEVSTANNAKLKLSASTPDISLSTAGSSEVSLSMEKESQRLSVSTAGSSKTSVTARTDRAELSIDGTSSLQIGGGANIMNVKGDKNCKLDAKDFAVKEAAISAEDCQMEVNVSDRLKVALSYGATLYFNGTPTFEIEKIIRSTLAPAGTTK